MSKVIAEIKKGYSYIDLETNKIDYYTSEFSYFYYSKNWDYPNFNK